MTLRVELKIVPHGVENASYDIFRLDISNIGTIRDRGFGHVDCKYSVKLFHRNPPYIEERERERWSLERETIVEEHDRREGALVLVKQALALLEGPEKDV